MNWKDQIESGIKIELNKRLNTLLYADDPSPQETEDNLQEQCIQGDS